MYSDLISLALDPVVNFGKVTVSTGYTSTALSVILNPGEGAKLPDPSVSGWYNLVWWNSTDYADPSDDPNVEIVRVTSNIANTLGILRGQEGTLTSNKNTPGKTYKLILSPTKKIVSDIQTDAQNRVNTHTSLTSTHGVLGNIVGTTDIQTLTNKIISGNNNTISNIDFETAIKQDTFSNQSFQNLLQNGNFEFWYAGTNVAPTLYGINAGAGYTIAKETSIVKSKGASVKIINGANQYAVLQTYLSNAGSGNHGWVSVDYQGKTFTYGAWVKTNSSLVYISMGDNIGNTKTYHTGSNNWEFLTVTRTINAAATEFWINFVGIDATASQITMYIDGAILVEGSVVPAFMEHAFDKVLNETRFKVGSFTRDISATGNQAVTGVGFKPSGIIFLSLKDNTGGASFGLTDGSASGDLIDRTPCGPDTWTYSTTYVISILIDCSNIGYASLASMDSDGFTITWTKTGSPTGTANIMYMAFR